MKGKNESYILGLTHGGEHTQDSRAVGDTTTEVMVMTYLEGVEPRDFSTNKLSLPLSRNSHYDLWDDPLVSPI